MSVAESASDSAMLAAIRPPFTASELAFCRIALVAPIMVAPAMTSLAPSATKPFTTLVSFTVVPVPMRLSRPPAEPVALACAP